MNATAPTTPLPKTPTAIEPCHVHSAFTAGHVHSKGLVGSNLTINRLPHHTDINTIFMM